MRAEVNGCIGCGACISACPAVFHFEDGLAQGGEIPPNQEGAASEAADGCPVGAITITEG